MAPTYNIRKRTVKGSVDAVKYKEARSNNRSKNVDSTVWNTTHRRSSPPVPLLFKITLNKHTILHTHKQNFMSTFDRATNLMEKRLLSEAESR
jgi:hypothetical protein